MDDTPKEFAKALQACMALGCGKVEDDLGAAEPWRQNELADAIGVSDRAIRQWRAGERLPDFENYDELLRVMRPQAEAHRQAYEQLKSARPLARNKPSFRTNLRLTGESLPPIPPDARPYRGLESFREEDAAIFFGRDALVRIVLDKLAHHRLVLLMGASGSGKSSLINAGILPKLRQDPARTIVRCTPGDRAIANLAAALARTLDPDRSPADLWSVQQTYKQQLQDDPAAIRDVAQLLPHGRLFLVIDQFEESFTLTHPREPEQHQALIATLLAIAESPDEQRLDALLGMRSDFLNELETADPRLVQTLDNAMVQMRALLPDELEATVTGPLSPYGFNLESGLLTAVAGDLKGNPDALPLLEVALDELWQRRDDANRQLTTTAYKAIGGITGALARRADQALEHLGLDEARVRHLLLQLVRVDPEGAGTKTTRRPRTRTELGNDLWQLGQKLAAHTIRLLATRRDDTTGTETLDLTHEALLRQWPRLEGWIDEERNFLLFCQRLDERMAEFKVTNENADYLLPKTDLQTAIAWQNEAKTFGPDQQDYIARSDAFWADQSAHDEARALWERLELLFFTNDRITLNDLSALGSLPWCAVAVRRHFLKLAVTNRNVARKLNRQGGLVLRATLGIDPNVALDIARPIIEISAEYRTIEPEVAWVMVASLIRPMLPSITLDIVKRAHFIANNTIDRESLKLTIKGVKHIASSVAGKIYRDLTKKLENEFKANDPPKPESASPLKENETSSFLNMPISYILNQRSRKSRIEILINMIADTTDHYRLSAILDIYITICKPNKRGIADYAANAAISIMDEIHEPIQIGTVAHAVIAIADRLDPAVRQKAIQAIHERLAEIALNNSDLSQITVLGDVINDTARWLTHKERSKAAERVVDKVLDALDGEESLWGTNFNGMSRLVSYLQNSNPSTRMNVAVRALKFGAFRPNRAAFAIEFINSVIVLFKNLSREDTETMAENVLDVAANADSIRAMRVAARALDNLESQMAPMQVIFVCTELLKHVLGGDDRVTETLLRSTTNALARHDLLGSFPEQSFWAVMQHLAELKAANPEWHWLDLARPPLPAEELLAEFRRLCADPPAWPATAPA